MQAGRLPLVYRHKPLQVLASDTWSELKDYRLHPIHISVGPGLQLLSTQPDPEEFGFARGFMEFCTVSNRVSACRLIYTKMNALCIEMKSWLRGFGKNDVGE